MLGADRCVIANLYDFPADDLPALSVAASDAAGWTAARPKLISAVSSADLLLAAWGLTPLSGAARALRHGQLSWLQDLAADHGHNTAWCIGGEPRHPSRWHQYVSDRHGRTTSGSFEERLDQVLVTRSLQSLIRR